METRFGEEEKQKEKNISPPPPELGYIPGGGLRRITRIPEKLSLGQ